MQQMQGLQCGMCQCHAGLRERFLRLLKLVRACRSLDLSGGGSHGSTVEGATGADPSTAMRQQPEAISVQQGAGAEQQASGSLAQGSAGRDGAVQGRAGRISLDHRRQSRERLLQQLRSPEHVFRDTTTEDP